MHLKPVLVPLPVEQVNHLNIYSKLTLTHPSQAAHLSRTGQAFVHPKPDIEAFEEFGLDENRQPVLASDLLVGVEAEVDCALQRSLNQGGQCREILNRSPTLLFYCLCVMLFDGDHPSRVIDHDHATSEAQKHGFMDTRNCLSPQFGALSYRRLIFGSPGHQHSSCPGRRDHRSCRPPGFPQKPAGSKGFQ